MKIVSKPISLTKLREMAQASFGNLVKAVVDIEKEIMVVDGELHADEEALLIENGSRQENLWGINFYPEIEGGGFIEFDSMINIRPSLDNFSRGIDDKKKKNQVIKIVNKLVKK